MKNWFIAKRIGKGTFEDPYRPFFENIPKGPYLGRFPSTLEEFDNGDTALNFSALQISSDEYLCCVGASHHIMQKIFEGVTQKKAREVSDDEAWEIIKENAPNTLLKDFNVIDPEVVFFAHIFIELENELNRMQKPNSPEDTRNIEIDILRKTGEIFGLMPEYWDSEIKKAGKWKHGKELEDDVLDGRTEAHEFVLSRIREKTNQAEKAKQGVKM